jgi:hypothetical protein
MVPFFKTVSYPLGVFGFIFLTWFVIVGASNAVNFTDGLDGLAIMPVVMVGSALGIFAYITGNAVFASTCCSRYIPGAGELLVFCAAMAGAGLAFLWFNATRRRSSWATWARWRWAARWAPSPSSRGRRSCWASWAASSSPRRCRVMVQVAWFKYTKKKYGEGRRIFLMAPLHHHFEKKGWAETQVVVRFWIITMLLCLVGLASLKAALSATMNLLRDLPPDVPRTEEAPVPAPPPVPVLVLGLGESGLAMARWCARQGAAVRVWDSREQAPQACGTARAGRLGDALRAGRLVLKSPGLPHARTPLLAARGRHRCSGAAWPADLKLVLKSPGAGAAWTARIAAAAASGRRAPWPATSPCWTRASWTCLPARWPT